MTGFHEYYTRTERNIRDEIRKQNDSYIVGVDTDEYAEYLFSKFGFEEITIDTDRKIEIEKKREIRRERNLFGNPYDREYVYARWSKAAVTDESTPPESPQTTRSSPTLFFISAMLLFTKELMVQSGPQPHTLKRKLLSIFFPFGV